MHLGELNIRRTQPPVQTRIGGWGINICDSSLIPRSNADSGTERQTLLVCQDRIAAISCRLAQMAVSCFAGKSVQPIPKSLAFAYLEPHSRGIFPWLKFCQDHGKRIAEGVEFAESKNQRLVSD